MFTCVGVSVYPVPCIVAWKKMVQVYRCSAGSHAASSAAGREDQARGGRMLHTGSALGDLLAGVALGGHVHSHVGWLRERVTPCLVMSSPTAMPKPWSTRANRCRENHHPCEARPALRAPTGVSHHRRHRLGVSPNPRPWLACLRCRR
jgi:hypothetical protein